MDRTYVEERITQTKALIDAYEAALLAFGTNGALQSYTLDTGQTRQTVTRANLTELQRILDSLYNRLCVFEARLKGGSIQARPGW